MPMVYVKCSADTVDLWARTLLLADHVKVRTTAETVLRRMLLRERAALGRKLGPGRMAEIEALYHKPKPARTSKAPPPAPHSYVD